MQIIYLNKLKHKNTEINLIFLYKNRIFEIEKIYTRSKMINANLWPIN